MIMTPTIAEIELAIHEKARLFKIDPNLLKAICQVESSLDPFAMRFEKNYIYLHEVREWSKKFNVSNETEGALQKFSYGLGQVMGAVAREYGYDEPLALLCADWKQALHFSAQHFAKFLKRYKKTDDAIAAYNAGAPRKTDGFYKNQPYVDKVLRAYKKIMSV